MMPTSKREKSKRPIVFLSYRRDDPEKVIALLYEKLVRLLPDFEVFRDQQSISPATDYQATLINAVLSSQLVVALIDQTWYQRWSRDDSGVVCDNADDWVFRELQTAIYHGIRILPVVIHPSREPSQADIPPSISELAFVQSVTYYPIPDADGSALKIADAIGRILAPASQSAIHKWIRSGLIFASVFITTLIASWLFLRPDHRLEKERFDKEVAAIRLNQETPVREHSSRAVKVPSLGQPDYSQFLILGDERVWDLRGFRQRDQDSPAYHSYAILKRHLRLVKQAPVKEIRFESRTSGAELIYECLSHPDRTTEYIAEAETLVAGQHMKVRQVVLDIEDIPAGQEMQITLRATFWDSLQTPEEWWVGAIGYPDSDYVRMIVVFPNEKPFTAYRLEEAPNSREKVKQFKGTSVVLANNASTALFWEIPKPPAGYVFRLSWGW